MTDDGSGEKERRTDPRTHITLKVEYPSVEGFLQDYTVNISRGGTMLRTNRQLSTNDRVSLILFFPGLLEAIHLQGEVRWVREEGPDDLTVGVAFDFQDSNAQRSLESLVNRLRTGDPAVISPTIRILMVEDNAYVARLISDGLAAFERRANDPIIFTTSHVVNGKEALSLLLKEQFDIMIVDIYLPVMDGKTLITTLRKDPRWAEIPIIAVSTGANEVKQIALEAGADFFLDKPFRLSDVLLTIRRLIASKRVLKKYTVRWGSLQ